MAPIDQAYTKMLNDIVLLIVGGIGGVMTKRAAGAASKAVWSASTSDATNVSTNGLSRLYGRF
jgi:hypothetical protein